MKQILTLNNPKGVDMPLTKPNLLVNVFWSIIELEKIKRTFKIKDFLIAKL